MAQERHNRLAQGVLFVRQHAPIVRQHFADWLDACKHEPRLIWETAAVRYSVYLLGGLILIKSITAGVSAFSPPLPASAKPAATKADFHVLCTDPACTTHFVIHRGFGFDDFPVQCPQCRKETGQPARPCASPQCRGAWVAAIEQDGRLVCPQCGGAM